MADGGGSSGGEGDASGIVRALYVDRVLAEIAVQLGAMSSGLAVALKLSHAWRTVILTEPRVWHTLWLNATHFSAGSPFASLPAPVAAMVQEVHLAPRCVGLASYAPLVNFVRAASRLTKLTLPMNGGGGVLLSELEAMELGSALPLTLSELSVRGHHCGITDAWLAELCARCPLITTLDMSECTRLRDIASSVQGLQGLRHLRIFDCDCVSHDALARLGRAHAFSSLDVGRTKAGFPLLSALGGSPAAATMLSLSLRSCLLNEDAIVALSDLSALTDLDLSCLNDNSSVSSLVLCGAIGRLTQLRSLAVSEALLHPIDTTLIMLSANEHLCEQLGRLAVCDGGLGVGSLRRLLPLRNLRHLELTPHPLEGLRHADSVVSAARALIEMSDFDREMLAEAKWWRPAWLQSTPMRAAMALESLRRLPLWHARDVRRDPAPPLLLSELDSDLQAVAACSRDDLAGTGTKFGFSAQLARLTLFCVLWSRAEQVVGRLRPATASRVWCSPVGRLLDAAARELPWQQQRPPLQQGEPSSGLGEDAELASRLQCALQAFEETCMRRVVWLDEATRAKQLRFSELEVAYLARQRQAALASVPHDESREESAEGFEGFDLFD